MKVYVVEDSDAICERIVRMVNEVKDTNVVGTADVVSGAIRGIEKCQPEVVILDIQLLDGNGSILTNIAIWQSAMVPTHFWINQMTSCKSLEFCRDGNCTLQ
jgi:chemotaxis response regulator CheB